MNFWILLALAVALAMDTFAVAIGVSISRRGLSLSQTFRLSFHFALFQFLMPVLGWAAGRTVITLIQAYDHWVAAGLLVFIGGKMIVESFHKEDRLTEEAKDVTRGWSLIVLAVATSLDALAVGLSLGALKTTILYPAAVIGAVTFVISAAGAKIGPILGKLAGIWAELAGGSVLILIAAKILIEHL